MLTKKLSPTTRHQHRNALMVHPDAKTRVLKEIVLKPHPDARRGEGNPVAQQERKRIQQAAKQPVESIVTCLDDNQRWPEVRDAIDTFVRIEQGDTVEPIPVVAREEATADNELRLALNDYFAGDHSPRVMRVLYQASEILEHAAHAIHVDAAAALFTTGDARAEAA